MSETSVEPTLRIEVHGDTRDWVTELGLIAMSAVPVAAGLVLRVAVFDLLDPELESYQSVQLPANDQTEAFLTIIARAIAKAVRS